MPTPTVTIVLPTYEEVESLPSLIQAVKEVRKSTFHDLQLIIVDDNSQDGTEELISNLGKGWIRLLIRTEDKGLSPAVIDGVKEVKTEFCIVMDADGSHPASAIPAMVNALQNGADFTVGSRYVTGGTTEDGWGFLRWLNSKIATLMARPFTKVLDPMSGFLGFKKSTFDAAKDLSPVGYKIGLELIVKCDCKNVVEVPIHFSTRQLGESKLTLSVQWQYLQHVIRLMRHCYPSLVSFFSFAIVGMIGVGVYTLLLMGATRIISTTPIAIALAIWLTMSWNFYWDRRFAFWDSHHQSFLRQYFGFVCVCTIGALVNFFITLYLSESESVPLAGAIGATIGAAVGLAFNFFMSRIFVFSKK